MSFDDGREYNAKLMPIARGDVLPDRSVPVEWITYDLWESMRALDRKLADEILEPVFTFMRAQTDPRRKDGMGLGEYLEYRERDVGKASVNPHRFPALLIRADDNLNILAFFPLSCAS